MGISSTGYLIVGGEIEELNVELVEDEHGEHGIWEFIKDTELETYSPYFDADMEDSYIGFQVTVPETKDGLTVDWLNEIKPLFDKYKEITGNEATLMTIADVG